MKIYIINIINDFLDKLDPGKIFDYIGLSKFISKVIYIISIVINWVITTIYKLWEISPWCIIGPIIGIGIIVIAIVVRYVRKYNSPF